MAKDNLVVYKEQIIVENNFPLTSIQKERSILILTLNVCGLKGRLNSSEFIE